MFVDAIIAHDASATVVAVVLSGGLIGLYWMTANFDANIGFGLTDRVDLYLCARLAEIVNRVPGIEHFERPDYLAELDLIDLNRNLLAGGPRQALTVLQTAVRGATMIGLLASVHPALALLPVAGVVPALAEAQSVRIRQRADEDVAEPHRLADQLFALTATAAPAKELRVYGLGAELTDRHRRAADAVARRTTRAAVAGAGVAAAGWLVFIVAFVAAIALVIRQAVNGHATPGQVVLAVVLAQQVRLLLAQIAQAVGQLLTTLRTAGRVLWLEDYATSATPVGRCVPPPHALAEGVRLDRVTFRYPGTDADVLTDVSLTIDAGTSVAIVGDNGAGKTTLVKLLAGMYQPTAGSIVIDGTNLADIAIDEWRSSCAAAFQDFVMFELSARHTVGVGDLLHLDDPDFIGAALGRAGATEVIEGLSEGLDTQLGRSFPNGHELSGGQWQKLALARGRMRDQPLLLVLDEPTANLDPETEDALFRRFAEAARHTRAATGGITVLVSHRFSTVQAADLIIVLKDGRVIEHGSHAQLRAAHGLYDELFRLQAAAYQ